MNLFYWNLHNNANIEHIICDALEENNVDIFLCSEYDNVDFNRIFESLSNYVLLDDYDICKKVKVIYKKNIKLELLQAQNRYILFKIITNSKTFLMTGIHLPSNPNSNSDDRKYEIRKIVSDIIDYEKKIFIGDNNLSIVIGDMNANPFDIEMINKDSFNCVFFKDIIERQNVVSYRDESYEMFYNPMLTYMNEENKSYGSFYYSSGLSTLYWYCFDQILVRKNLVNKLHSVRYIKKINEIELINKVAPNKEISDHLPLFVNISLED